MANITDKEIKEMLGENFEKLKNIRETIEVRGSFLEDVMKGKFAQRLSPSESTRFVITRKWSSWAPSFFDITGGCYAFLLPRETKTAVSENRNAIIIDPGFKFLESLRRYGVDVSNIDSVVVSHFHPDHMAGLMELLTLVQESDHTVKLYLNSTTFSFFSKLGTKNAEFIELNEKNRIRLSTRTLSDDSIERLYIEPRKAFHREMGARGNSLSLIFVIERESNEKVFQEKMVILGDTDGLEHYFDEYIQNLSGANEVILHLGTIGVENYGKGYKHLYDVGLLKLLRRLKNEVDVRHSKDFENLKAIVISEFGLEMASSNYLREVVALYTPAAKWQAMLLLVSLLKERDGILVSGELKDEEKKEKEKKVNFEIEVVAKTFLDLLARDTSIQPSLSRRYLAEQAFLTYAAAFCLIISHFDLALRYWNEMKDGILALLEEYPKTDEQGEALYAPTQADLVQHLVPETHPFVEAATKTVSKISGVVFQVVEEERQEEVANMLLNFARGIKEFSFWQLREASDIGKREITPRTLYGRQGIKSVLRRIEELLGRSKDWAEIQETLDNNTQLSLHGLLFSALLTKVVTSAKENQFKDLKVSTDFMFRDMEVFQEFLDVARTLAPKHTNLLIGDEGFIVSFDFENEKYVTRARVLNAQGEYCWEDIAKVRCKETRDGNINYLQAETT